MCCEARSKCSHSFESMLDCWIVEQRLASIIHVTERFAADAVVDQVDNRQFWTKSLADSDH